LMLSMVRAPPQDWHFIVSRSTSPGRSMFKLTSPAWEVVDAGRRRLANQITPKPIPTLITPMISHPKLPSGLKVAQMNKIPKKIKIAAKIYAIIFPADIYTSKIMDVGPIREFQTYRSDRFIV
jgi:hypothetical protein